MRRAVLSRISLTVAALVLLFAGPAAAQALAPSAVTGAASAVDRDTALLHGTVNPRGLATDYWFEYGRTAGLGSRTPTADAGNGLDAFAVDQQIGSLRAGTTYRYRLVARNATGTTQGAVRSFRTDAAPAPKPSASTGSVRDITESSATLSASLNNRSRDASYHFEWGTTTNYGQSTPATALPADAKAQDVTFPLTGLAANTSYHVRVVLQVGDDTMRGRDRGFRTAKIPNGLLLKASGNPVRYGAGVDVFGVLAGSDNTGTVIRVQADTYPFDGSWSTVASGRTDATGAYRVHVEPLLTSSQLRTIAETSPAVTSQSITVGVRLTTSLRVSSHRVRRGKRVRFKGRITPTQPHAAISIQNRRGHRWVTIGHTRAGGGSRFSTRVRVRRTGKYRVVARPTDGGHVMGPSSSRYIRVRR
jgi:hypothetical protein